MEDRRRSENKQNSQLLNRNLISIVCRFLREISHYSSWTYSLYDTHEL